MEPVTPVVEVEEKTEVLEKEGTAEDAAASPTPVKKIWSWKEKISLSFHRLVPCPQNDTAKLENVTFEEAVEVGKK